MISKIRAQLKKLFFLPNRIASLHDETKENIDSVKLLLGKMLSAELLKRGILPSIHEAEFSIFSQGGDDGILQYLTHHVTKIPKVYVDIGGGNYTQPDTRFLLQNNRWKGYIMDRLESETIKKKEFYSIFDLTRIQSFVTAENINEIMPKEEIGFLNIDIDGNDYHVLKAMKARPAIIAAEYNSYFKLHPITIEYNPSFDRNNTDFGTQYCGVSLRSLYDLLTERGYAFVGCNTIGINAYFVRKDVLGEIPSVSLEDGYVKATIKLHHLRNKHVDATEEEYIKRFYQNAPFYDTEKGTVRFGRDIFDIA